MTILFVSDAVAGYGGAEEILKGLSLHVNIGEIVTVIGPNGAGKSTLLKAIAGLVPLKKGSIRFEGVDVTHLDALGRAGAGIALVPQERNVFGGLNVAENLSVSASLSPAEEKRRAAAMFDRYPVLWDKRKALARTLSGGQRQILAMAMALMSEPCLLLLDEPTAGLSPKAADELFSTIVELNASVPVLMIEQHAIEALSISTRGYVVVSGKVHADGTGSALAENPDIRRLFLGS